MKGRRLIAITVSVALSGTAFLLWQGCVPGPVKVTPGKFPEELVYVQSKDHIPNGGVIFTSPKDSAKPIAVIWTHGWGVNFYQPTYVNIGRALAEHGYTCIAGNTRMHDLGNVAWVPTLTGEKRIRAVAIGAWQVSKCETPSDFAAISVGRKRLK